MAHDIFISYSSKDKPIADGICANLEAAGQRCWIAPRDIAPGEEWPRAITNAIATSRVMVLVFSSHSNASSDVGREIVLAANNNLVIIPFKIENIEPVAGKKYYLAQTHWLEAMNPPTAEQIHRLVERVRVIVPMLDNDALVPSVPVPVLFKEQSPTPGPALKRKWFRRESLWIGMALVLIVLAVTMWPKIQGLFASPTVTQLPAATSSPSETVEFVENLPDLTSTPYGGGDWRPVYFLIPNPQIWVETGDNRYTAIGQKSVDAFAWSTETYDGDLMVSLDLESPEKQSSGCVIIYGNGEGLSFGNLIFCVDWDGYGLEKHTIYHEGENRLAWYPSNVDLNARVYVVTIEIIGDTANMYVNGDKVLSSIFDIEEIDRKGKIGVYKKWIDPEVTFSNIRVRSLNGNE